jgi:hypothetical protein
MNSPPKEIYQVDTVVHLKRNGEFAIITDRTFLKMSKASCVTWEKLTARRG